MRILGCDPRYFDIIGKDEYGNMFMDPKNRPIFGRVPRQWKNLFHLCEFYGLLKDHIEPKAGLPDMTFAANCGLTFEKDGKKCVILSNFRPPRREGEKEVYREWFKEKGYEIFELPEGIYFEGAGDAIPFDDVILVGYGFRTSREALPFIQKITGKTVVPLELQKLEGDKKNFYHLDTAMIVAGVEDRLIITCPEAFTDGSYGRLKEVVNRHAGHLVAVSYEDAKDLALNALVIPISEISEAKRGFSGSRGIMVTSSTASEELIRIIRACEYNPQTLSLSEFIKAGGGAFCLIKILEYSQKTA